MAQIERNKVGHYVALTVIAVAVLSLLDPNLLDCCHLPEITG